MPPNSESAVGPRSLRQCLAPYVRLARPEQWTKQAFVFAALFFGREYADPASVGRAILAAIAFCLLSSGGYVINDILDRPIDRANAQRASRPLAAGEMTVPAALVYAVVLLAGGTVLALLLPRAFTVTALAYLLLTSGYSAWAKHVVLVDVIVVAAGYVLRAIGGATAIAVEISPWLMLCTFLLALFIVLCKRRTELAVLTPEPGRRPVLAAYRIDEVDRFITMAGAACIVCYCIYTLTPETVIKFRTRALVLTVPFVIYGLFRFMIIASRPSAGPPERMLFRDVPLMLAVVAWLLTCLVAIH